MSGRLQIAFTHCGSFLTRHPINKRSWFAAITPSSAR